MRDVRTGYIYRIAHKSTDRSYVGQSLNFPTGRWSDHIRRPQTGTHNLKFQASWRESEITDWMFEVLECGIRKGDLDAREAYWVKKLDAIHHGFNATTRVGRNVGRELVAKRVVEMVKNGKTYREVSSSCGIAVGSVTNIMRRHTVVSPDLD